MVEIRALLYAIAAAIVDLDARDPQTSEWFRNQLQFHVANVIHVIPESREAAAEATFDLHQLLLTMRLTLTTELRSMTPEERSEGIRMRQEREQLFGFLNLPQEPQEPSDPLE